MNTGERIRVAVVEDDEVLREALVEAIEPDPRLVVWGAFPSAEALAQVAPDVAPQVIIMDLNLPGINGIDCTRQVKARWPSVQVLVCTVQDDDESLFNALCAGATGFLLKDAGPAQVAEAVKSIAAGGSPMSAGIARRVLASFSAPRKTAKEMDLLSSRERQILEQLARGLRYKEIADTLHLSIDTVRTHVRNLYDKLHVSSRTDALNKLYPR
ncbi:MAG: response regulator transcription factor [Flavobacteriales bacterium]|nr:response regulator transcription factor [Flavobacteriales bacterium]MBP9080827.1 response regulator transcription factor [Flavobacteriales bacterium]